ncbi:MAG: hypothetical protein PHN75_04030 [Syntrophales bacterium]|nr:hypothetical protein [Syntrophales bacterium]
MKRMTIILTALLGLFCIAGCTPAVKEYVASYVEIAKEKGMSGDYLTSLQRWTREETAYSEFETKFYICATYKSADFTKAYFREQARLLHLTEEDRIKREAEQLQAASDFTEFFFYAYTAERVANDFANRSSMWHVFLVDEKGKQVEPLEIRRIERDKVTPMIESFFPYVKKYFGYCYILKFPKQTSDSVKVVYASSLGKLDLDWKALPPVEKRQSK